MIKQMSRLVSAVMLRLKRAMRLVAPTYILHVAPGHFYSPLNNLNKANFSGGKYRGDGAEYWAEVNLELSHQLKYTAELFAQPSQQIGIAQGHDFRRYKFPNHMFSYSDARFLSLILANSPPARVIEIGSGFSTAVFLDTLEQMGVNCAITCVEPYPVRLRQLLSTKDLQSIEIVERCVQELDVRFFDQLVEGDVLFIDSSHVAKVDSDVTYLYLRVLPRLKRGVRVHIHDIFYPTVYPEEWIKEGRAWNESLFLRAFLINNTTYRINLFNSFLMYSRPDFVAKYDPRLLDAPGGSFWMEKVL